MNGAAKGETLIQRSSQKLILRHHEYMKAYSYTQRQHVLFLPFHSPDLSPIEEAFSKLKAFLRHAGARTHEDLHEAIIGVLAAITAQDALGWFQHCGYHS